MSNSYTLGDGFFLCYTQAGFRKVLKSRGIGSDERKSINAHPKSYPAVVHVSWIYVGHHRPNISILYVPRWIAFFLKIGKPVVKDTPSDKVYR